MELFLFVAELPHFERPRSAVNYFIVKDSKRLSDKEWISDVFPRFEVGWSCESYGASDELIKLHRPTLLNNLKTKEYVRKVILQSNYGLRLDKLKLEFLFCCLMVFLAEKIPKKKSIPALIYSQFPSHSNLALTLIKLNLVKSSKRNIKML